MLGIRPDEHNELPKRTILLVNFMLYYDMHYIAIAIYIFFRTSIGICESLRQVNWLVIATYKMQSKHIGTNASYIIYSHMHLILIGLH